MKWDFKLRGKDTNWYDLLFSVSVAINAKIIVEMGTGDGAYGGGSTHVFLEAVKITDGVLYSVDKRPCKEVRERFSKENKVTFILSDSVEFGRQWKGGNIDILLCDSDHSRSHVFNELKTWEKFNPKVVFIHDISGPLQQVGEPYKGIMDYLGERPDKKFIAFLMPNGLGMIV